MASTILRSAAGRKSARQPLSKSEIMARIRSRDTKPELSTRSALHRLGYRFRVNVKSLPGTPDIAIRSRRVAIFVHGCFWHLHSGCALARVPRRNVEYWVPKLRRNSARDEARQEQLRKLGFSVLVVWECETANPATLEEKLSKFMMSSGLPRPKASKRSG
ncbi:MAG TPA: DNA mismatch endonuclease Vsr [Alphaproteobacteria bacterium]|nr:DNA mismatch endonuclease Vsr [Alphaproteobacteria bacterium]